MRYLALVVVASACPAPPVATVPQPKPVVVAPIVVDAAVTTPVAPEVEPKLRLPRNFTPTGYTAKLVIDPAQPSFTGAIAIAGTLSARSAVIWLHGRKLDVHHATAAHGDPGVALTVTPHGEDLLELRADPPLEPGTWTIALEYTGVFDEINTTGAFKQIANKQRYIYTQFEALYARRVFPCLDEPDSKVPWKLAIDVPKGQLAVSNTPIEVETALPDGGRRFEFAQTKPLPSYLIAFGVGPFDIVPAGASKSGVPLRIFVPKGRGAEAAYAAKTASHVIDLLEDWFGMGYPYPKLDFLTIPITSGFGAMENAGLITMVERLVLLDAKPSWDRRLDWIRVSAHESAHQWFGDLVTTAWWDDIWLNEGFATWMELKITERFDPTWHIEAAELDSLSFALKSDSLVTARRIRQPIEATDDILNVFDGITYDKGASVLNMFEAYLGRDVFQRGVREYIAARANGNATSTDFVAAISKVAGKDLAPAFATFLDQGGVPELVVTLTCDHTPKLAFSQHRFVAPGSPAAPATRDWVLPICVAFDRGGKRAEACTLLDAPSGTLVLDAATCPRWVMPNVNGRGYYTVRPTPAQVTALRDEAWPLLAASERRAVFRDVVRAATYGSTLPFTLALSLVPKLISDRSALHDVLDLLERVDPLVPDELRGKLEGWYRMTFGPGVTKLGIVPKDSDDLDAETMRVDFLEAAAWRGRDPELVKQVVELAAKWRELPDSIRATALKIAVDANADAFERARSEVKVERSRDRRRELFAALAAVRDVKRYQAALEIVSDRALDLREAREIIFAPSSEGTRRIADRFVRDHESELAKRLPQDETARGLWDLAMLLTRACDPTQHDEVVDYMTKHVAPLPGADRVVKNATEQLDQCIASRAALDPALRGWLGGVKLPRPATPKKK